MIPSKYKIFDVFEQEYIILFAFFDFGTGVLYIQAM